MHVLASVISTEDDLTKGEGKLAVYPQSISSMNCEQLVCDARKLPSSIRYARYKEKKMQKKIEVQSCNYFWS